MKNWQHDGVRIVHAGELDTNTPQTPGMSRAAGRFLEKYGTFGQIERLGAAIDPANKAAVDMYNELVKNIFSPLRGAASKQMTDPLASERQKIAQERQKLQEGEQNQFKESVKKDVNTEVRSQISKQVSALLKGKTVSERVLTNIETEISRQVNADPNYSKQVGAGFSKPIWQRPAHAGRKRWKRRLRRCRTGRLNNSPETAKLPRGRLSSNLNSGSTCWAIRIR